MCIAVSAFVALTLTPMMASRFLRARRDKHGRLYQITERGFDKLLRGYERGLDIVLRHQFATLMRVLCDAGRLPAYLFVAIPKGSSRSRILASSPAYPRPRKTSPSPR